MKKKIFKYTILSVAALFFLIAAYGVLFGFVRVDLSSSSTVTILFFEQTFAQSDIREARIAKGDDDALFSALVDIVAEGGYRTKLNQGDYYHGHSYPARSFRLSFVDAATNTLLLDYTIYSDGVLIMDEKYMACGLLSPRTPDEIYAALEALNIDFKQDSQPQEEGNP